MWSWLLLMSGHVKLTACDKTLQQFTCIVYIPFSLQTDHLLDDQMTSVILIYFFNVYIILKTLRYKTGCLLKNIGIWFYYSYAMAIIINYNYDDDIYLQILTLEFNPKKNQKLGKITFENFTFYWKKKGQQRRVKLEEPWMESPLFNLRESVAEV